MRFGNIEYILAGSSCYIIGISREEELLSALDMDFLFILENKGVKTLIYGDNAEHSIKLTQCIEDIKSSGV